MCEFLSGAFFVDIYCARWPQVAVMERQMKKLEQDVAGCDGEPVRKLAECTKQEFENQVYTITSSERLLRSSPSRMTETLLSTFVPRIIFLI